MSLALATRGRLCVRGRVVLSFVSAGTICISGVLFPFDWGFTVPTAPLIESPLFNKNTPALSDSVLVGDFLAAPAFVTAASKQAPDLYNKEESDLYNKESGASSKEEADIFNK